MGQKPPALWVTDGLRALRAGGPQGSAANSEREKYMGDFFQNGIITTLHDFGTADPKRMENRLYDILKRREIALILPIIPRDLMSSAFNGIVAELSKVPYISEVVLSLGQTDKFEDFVEAKRRLKPLHQSHSVVWSSGPGP